MSDYLDPNNEELLKDFFSEATMQLELLEQNILAVEDDPNDSDAIDEIFRAAHTLKGGSATVQMTELAEFTHLVEDLLDAIRSGDVKISSDVVDALLTGIDIIKAMLECRQNGEVYSENIDPVKKTLKDLSEGKTGTPSSPSIKGEGTAKKTVAVVGNDDSQSALSEYEILELKEAAGNKNTVYQVRVYFDESNPMNSVGGIQIFAKLKNVSQVLKTVPEFDLLYEDNFFPIVDYYIATEEDSNTIKTKTETPDVTLSVDVISLDSVDIQEVPSTESDEENVSSQYPDETIQEEDASSEINTETEQLIQEQRPETEKKKNKSKDKATGSVLRVDSKRIDNLLNLVSEAVINKATFNQISTKFMELQSELMVSTTLYKEKLKALFEEIPELIETAQNGSSVKDLRDDLNDKYENLYSTFDDFENRFKSHVTAFKSTAGNLGRNTGDLHEAILRIRMVPISQIFSRFPRLVRDLSKSLDKRVDLIIEGEDTELDKSVIEELLDPLMHCVRNSLDHGIETKAIRNKLGKQEDGRLLLKASNEGNMIIIEVADDGAGIDIEKVRSKAIERGLIHPGKNLSDIEAFNLIFEPGFSTAKEVTNISGRGVGLDVVKREIEKLNGSVSVWSKLGEGTKFTIKLPLTLAIIQGLLVKVGNEVYAIPITSVIESLRIKPDEINIIDNYEVFNIRNDVISLLRLNTLFNISNDQEREHNFVVIVGSGDKKMGLMVDSLIGEEDVVIKPLKDKYTNSPGIAGATILGDGTVSLIIDVSQLLDLGVQKEQKARAVITGKES